MEFREIGEKEKSQWDGFVIANSPESFLQSFDWGRFQESYGRGVFRFAVFEGGEILALASAIEHRLPLGFRYWYVPRGPVVLKNFDRKKENEILDFLTRNLKSEASRRRIIFIRMDPAHGKDRIESFVELGFSFMSGNVQPKDTLVLDLMKNENELLSNMKQKTRYNLRLAEKKGVFAFYRKTDEENFEEFWNLIKETSERDQIISHDKKYYQKMLQTLDSEDNTLKSRLYFSKVDGTILAANIVLLFGDYAVYLHGASSNKFRNLMAPYLLQWQQIRDARNSGCRTYDFWGITIDNAQSKWEGITRFKKGFGGQEVSYAGVFDLPVSRIWYKLYLLARNRKV